MRRVDPAQAGQTARGKTEKDHEHKCRETDTLWAWWELEEDLRGETPTPATQGSWKAGSRGPRAGQNRPLCPSRRRTGEG